jgi:hypothetical protein
MRWEITSALYPQQWNLPSISTHLSRRIHLLRNVKKIVNQKEVVRACIIYCAIDEILLIDSKRQATAGGARQIIGSSGLIPA